MSRIEMAMTTDFAGSKVAARPQLEKIAKAGFTDAMWCHGWNTSTLYSQEDISAIKGMFRDNNLGLVDVHGSIGTQREFLTPNQELQNHGIELVKNRMELAATLDSDTVVMHVPAAEGWWIQGQEFWTALDRALTTIAPDARRMGVKIAFENLEHKPNNFATIHEILAKYPEELVGLCYDTGHGNVHGNGLDDLEQAKDRLTAVHIHDNSGKSDEHLMIFEGTNNWSRTADIFAASSYRKPLSFELGIGNVQGMDYDEDHLLKKAFEAGVVLHNMVQNARKTT